MKIKQYALPSGEARFKVVVIKKKTIRGRPFRVQYQDANCLTRVEAKKKGQKLLEKCIARIIEVERSGGIWGELVEKYGEALNSGIGLERKPTTNVAYDYQSALEIYTRDWWDRPVTSITRNDVRQVLEKVTHLGKSHARKKVVKTVIKGAFDYALGNGLFEGLRENPAFGIKIRILDEKPGLVLNYGEAKKLLDAAQLYEHPWYPVWTAALYTGMRSGELFALLWSDVDLETGIISCSKSFDKRNARIGPTKGRYARDVAISPDLKEFLVKLKAEAGDRPEVLPRFKEWDRGDQAKVLKAFCIGIGITPIKFHDLRATFATLLLRARIAPAVIMKMCGWKDLKTMQRYVRLSAIEIQGATDLLKLIPEREVVENVINFRPSRV